MTTNASDRTSRIGDVGIKAPCRVCATATLTLSGTQTIDGVAVVAGDRVLVTGQASAIDNGIYVADTGDWARATDFDGSYDAANGTLVYVTSGTSNGGFWYLTATNPVQVGTSSQAWGRASTALAVVSAFMQTVLDDTTAAAARTTLAAAGSGAVTGGDLTMSSGKFLGRLSASTGAIEEIQSYAAQFRLSYLNSSQLQLGPYNGCLLSSNGSIFDLQGTYSQGVTVSANTLYYIYAYRSANNWLMEASTTVPVASGTSGNRGIMIKTGDGTRTLVGMVYTDGSGLFTSTMVRSWANRKPLDVTAAFTAQRTTTSGTNAELNTEIRCNFLCWDDDTVIAESFGYFYNSTTQYTSSGIAFDGTTCTEYTTEFGTGGAPCCQTTTRGGLSTGLHYATLVGLTTSGSTGTWGISGGPYASLRVHVAAR